MAAAAAATPWTSWVSLGLGVAGALFGKKSSKAAQESLALQREMLNFYRSLWSDYQDTYGDFERDFVKESRIGLDPRFYADRAEADVRSAYGRGRESYARGLTRYGLDPSEGGYQSAMSRMTGEEAAKAAGARTRTRMQVGDVNYARKRGALQMGQGLRSTILSGMSGAAGGLAGSYGKEADLYGGSAAGLIRAGLGLYGLNQMKPGQAPEGKPAIETWKPEGDPFKDYSYMGDAWSPKPSYRAGLPGYSF